MLDNVPAYEGSDRGRVVLSLVVFWAFQELNKRHTGAVQSHGLVATASADEPVVATSAFTRPGGMLSFVGSASSYYIDAGI